ncbi:hypothetical protein [Nonomuraea sp. SYSU D8015]|uniref:hypothetical protein n=1 Tax=Nonomuraea sp. SYSU D8015 TaxID=2593644 RepID=UPI0016609632|nr:hypothetical protein [Nonomuraea sp. SYSU D8015]
MLRLKSWTELSFRELERRAAAAGDSLPRSTISNALDRGKLPAAHLVEAFARACGCDEDEVAAWVRARRRVAAASVGEPDRPDASLGEPPATARSRSRRKLTVLFAVLVLIAAVAVWVAIRPAQPGQTREVASAPLKILPPSEAQLANPPSPAPHAKPVLYVGDSIAAETASAVSYFVHRSGKGAVTAATRPGAALCDFLNVERSRLVPEDRLSALVSEMRPAAVVLQFWGYSSADTPCTGGAKPGTDPYYAHYAAAAEQTTREIEQAYESYKTDATEPPRVLWVLQGPDRADPGRTRRLNEEIYREAGEVIDAGAQVSMAVFPYEVIEGGRYKWTQYLPCSEDERAHALCTHPKAFGGVTAVHPDTDDHLLCLNAATPERCLVRSPGLIRYSRAIAEAVVGAL